MASLVVNQDSLNRIKSYLNDPLYKEAIEHSASYNTRLCIERKMRLPFLDAQTGVAQSNCTLWMHKRNRMPGERPGQLYTYPAKRWRKRRRQYLVNFLRPRIRDQAEVPESGGDDHFSEFRITRANAGRLTKVERDFHPPVVETPSGNAVEEKEERIGEDSKDSWYRDYEEQVEPPESAEMEDGESDYDDYEETYTKRKKKKTQQRGAKRRSMGFDPATEQEKPYQCDLCGARYKTRPGLSYHTSHSHSANSALGGVSGGGGGGSNSNSSSGGGAVAVPGTAAASLHAPAGAETSPSACPSSSGSALVVAAAATTSNSNSSSNNNTDNADTEENAAASPTSSSANDPLAETPTNKAPKTTTTAAVTGTTTTTTTTAEEGSSGGATTSTSGSSGVATTTTIIQPGAKPTSNPSPYCDFCLGDANENKKTKQAEELVSCSDCGRSGHPTCLQFTPNMMISVKKYRWQCIECKCCTLCGTSDNDDQLLFCDDCDRGYHMYCLEPPLSEPPEGSWSCHLCIQEFHKK